MKLGLIDEYRLFVRPVILGGGKPYFPPLERAIDLTLVESRVFPHGVVMLRYAPAAARAHLERARKRIEETGYHRRDEELAGLEAEAGSTGA
jgi:dihydrofolate reductase